MRTQKKARAATALLALFAGVAGANEGLATQLSPLYEATFKNAGVKLELQLDLDSSAQAFLVDAYRGRGTIGEGGGPGTEYYTCNTDIHFNVGKAKIRAIDLKTSAVLSTQEKGIQANARFTSPAHADSVCLPHQYPSLQQEVYVFVKPEPFLLANEGTFVSDDASFRADMRAINRGGKWTLTALALQKQETIDPSSSIYAAVYGEGGQSQKPSEYVRMIVAGTQSPHQVLGQAIVSDCENFEKFPDTGSEFDAAFRFMFSYERKLPQGSRVFVKYSTVGGPSQSSGWSEDRVVALKSSSAGESSVWTGTLEIPNLRVTARKSYAVPKRILAQGNAQAPAALQYIFRVVLPDGKVIEENGSAARWGHYEASSAQGGLILPTACENSVPGTELLRETVRAYLD